MPKQRQGTRNESVSRMTDTLESCAATSQDDHAALMLGMAAKALTQLQSHNDRVMADAVDWKDKYEEMGQLFRELVGELEEEVEDLAEENEQLRVKYQEREEPLLMDLAGMNDHLTRENMSAEAPLGQTTITNTPRKNSFSGDVYNQLDEFENSLDMELEAFQRLELLTDELEHSLDRELDTMAPVQLKTHEPSKGMLKTLTGKPFQLLRRAFQAQDDEPMPALTTSDSLFSLSSSCSMSQASSQDLLGFAPAGKMTKMSPGPNAEWGIMA